MKTLPPTPDISYPKATNNINYPSKNSLHPYKHICTYFSPSLYIQMVAYHTLFYTFLFSFNNLSWILPYIGT